MLQKSWITMFIGLVAFTIIVGGCATTGPTAASSQQTVQSENEYAPDRGLDPNSPYFWLDYSTIYAPQ